MSFSDTTNEIVYESSIKMIMEYGITNGWMQEHSIIRGGEKQRKIAGIDEEINVV